MSLVRLDDYNGREDPSTTILYDGSEPTEQVQVSSTVYRFDHSEIEYR